MFRPFVCVATFEETGLAQEMRMAERYICIQSGSKGGRRRYIPVHTPERIAAIGLAQQTMPHKDNHMGQSGYSLKQAMRRFDYVMEKFGLTAKVLGVTAHGLRHEALINEFESQSGQTAPVRGGMPVEKKIEDQARKQVSNLAGHARKRAANAYLGQSAIMRSKARKVSPAVEPNDPVCA